MNKKVLLYYVVFIIPAIVIQVACSSFPKFPVEGGFIGERISTTVDSKIASYYLEDYLQSKNSNSSLDKRIDKLYARQKDVIPTREELKKISKEYSVYFAALFLADRLWANENNRKIQNHFNYFLKNKDLPLTTLNSSNNSYMVLFVPGCDYVESGYLTGSDFAKPRKLITNLGIENYLVEIPSHGSVEENADYITNDLLKRNQSGINIIIVGASSAGPAIYLSLAEKLSKYSKDKYPLLISEGPNDGVTLLSDIIAPSSLTIIALGSDHFFAEDHRINDKTVALAKVVISYLDKSIATPSIRTDKSGATFAKVRLIPMARL